MLSPLTSPSLASFSGIRHGFFTRRGGISEGLYAALNCGLGSGDDREAVLENRDRIARHLGSNGDRVLTCYQIHSADAVVVSVPWSPDSQPRADAIVTNTPGLVLGSLAADCAPVLFADPEASIVAAAHAGWKGALDGIIEATARSMESIGARRERITACLGPCIGRDAYEVGPEFEQRFLAAEPDYARYFHRPPGRERAHFDLPSFVLDRCRAARLGHVEDAHVCTYSDPNRFFSYRRATHLDEPDYGRQISAIMLAP